MNEITARKLKEDLEQGRLGSARDRLNGLVISFPDNLDLRRQLAEVYWKLGYPEHAGRFWFLEDMLDERQQGAVTAFLLSCRGDPELALKRLKLRMGIETLGAAAMARLEQLTPDLLKVLEANSRAASQRHEPTMRDKMTIGLIFLAPALAIIFMLVGFVVTLVWLIGMLF